MFSVMSVRDSVHMGKGSHVTITHNALDLTVQEPQSPSRHGPYWAGTPFPLY